MRWLLAALVVLLLAPAGAAATGPPTVAQSLAIADRYWGNHPCAGRVVVTVDHTLKSRSAGGEATGLTSTWNGTGWAWTVTSCAISIMPDTDGWLACYVIVHEVGHLVTGIADHTGAMSPERLNPKECKPPPTRQGLEQAIADSLPATRAWRVTCSAPGVRMRCRARARGQRVRRYSASLTATKLSWSYLGTAR